MAPKFGKSKSVDGFGGKQVGGKSSINSAGTDSGSRSGTSKSGVSKGGQTGKLSSAVQNEGSNQEKIEINGCPIILENGCLIGGTGIDEKNPGDAVRVACTNVSCPMGKFVHSQCMEAWEDHLVRMLENTSWAKNWTEAQRRNNLWDRRGGGLMNKTCRCLCKNGKVRRDLDYVAPPKKEEEPRPKPSKKEKKRRQRAGEPTTDANEAEAEQPKTDTATSIKAAGNNANSNNKSRRNRKQLPTLNPADRGNRSILNRQLPNLRNIITYSGGSNSNNYGCFHASNSRAEPDPFQTQRRLSSPSPADAGKKKPSSQPSQQKMNNQYIRYNCKLTPTPLYTDDSIATTIDDNRTSMPMIIERDQRKAMIFDLRPPAATRTPSDAVGSQQQIQQQQQQQQSLEPIFIDCMVDHGKQEPEKRACFEENEVENDGCRIKQERGEREVVDEEVIDDEGDRFVDAREQLYPDSELGSPMMKLNRETGVVTDKGLYGAVLLEDEPDPVGTTSSDYSFSLPPIQRSPMTAGKEGRVANNMGVGNNMKFTSASLESEWLMSRLNTPFHEPSAMEFFSVSTPPTWNNPTPRMDGNNDRLPPPFPLAAYTQEPLCHYDQNEYQYVQAEHDGPITTVPQLLCQLRAVIVSIGRPLELDHAQLRSVILSPGTHSSVRAQIRDEGGLIAAVSKRPHMGVALITNQGNGSVCLTLKPPSSSPRTDELLMINRGRRSEPGCQSSGDCAQQATGIQGIQHSQQHPTDPDTNISSSSSRHRSSEWIGGVTGQMKDLDGSVMNRASAVQQPSTGGRCRGRVVEVYGQYGYIQNCRPVTQQQIYLIFDRQQIIPTQRQIEDGIEPTINQGDWVEYYPVKFGKTWAATKMIIIGGRSGQEALEGGDEQMNGYHVMRRLAIGKSGEQDDYGPFSGLGIGEALLSFNGQQQQQQRHPHQTPHQQQQHNNNRIGGRQQSAPYHHSRHMMVDDKKAKMECNNNGNFNPAIVMKMLKLTDDNSSHKDERPSAATMITGHLPEAIPNEPKP